MSDTITEAVDDGVAIFGLMHPPARTEGFRAGIASDAPGGRLQRLAAAFVFGQLWGDERLDRRSRSLVTLGALVALQIGEEFGNHVRVALANGLTPVDVEEAITHTAAYAGFPAALSAMSAAKRVFEEQASREAMNV